MPCTSGRPPRGESPPQVGAVDTPVITCLSYAPGHLARGRVPPGDLSNLSKVLGVNAGTGSAYTLNMTKPITPETARAYARARAALAKPKAWAPFVGMPLSYRLTEKGL